MALELIDVHKSYPMNIGRKHVLRGVNAVFRKGERVGVLGRNGTGKSTLVRILGRVEAPTRGTIRSSMSVSWPIGMAAGFQSALSGADNSRFILVYDKLGNLVLSLVEPARFFEAVAVWHGAAAVATLLYHLGHGGLCPHGRFLALAVGLPEADIVEEIVDVGVETLFALVDAPDLDAEL